ncbi:MAG TPA: cation diffusion facilitator family transporter [Salinivirgaceae bacterium]|nr:cation diffusion facilitator family transporter [Salinivirgaceae bacterium]
MTKEHYRFGKTVGWISIIGNTVLFILKFWAGWVSDSVALMADAWHTLSDSVSSVILVIGIFLAQKPADKEHPFGHGRMELISSIIIGFLLGLIGIMFGYEGIEKLIQRQATVYGTVAIIATVISIVAKEAMAQVNFYFYRRTKLLSIKADGWHHRSDAISSIVILIGIFLGSTFWWIDGVLAIIVAILIIYTGYTVIRDSISPLIGENPSDELNSKISEIANSVAGYDIFVHHIHIHRYGMHTEVTFHIRLPKDLNLNEVEKMVVSIENKIKSELHMSATIRPQVYHNDQTED